MKRYIRVAVCVFIPFASCIIGAGFDRSLESKDSTVDNGLVIKNMIDTLIIEGNGIFELNHDYNLNGKTYIVPDGATIRQNNGLFKDGILIGNNTKIIAKSAIFDNVTIRGSWNVPEISTSYFADLSYDNSLRDVFGLANPNIHNKIIIQSGTYNFQFNKDNDVGIEVPSNSSVEIRGCLTIDPNSFDSYSIIRVSGDNVSITGDGVIFGDKDEHRSMSGEWGTGISIINARKCSIDGLTIKNCWGDCIYIGKCSEDISVNNCVCSNSRRQGISITSASNVYIGNTNISYIKGTNPQCAIDIEPNSRQLVNNVLIENVFVSNCVGGFITSANIDKKNAFVDNVEYRNCKLVDIGRKPPLNFKQTKSIRLIGCTIYESKYDYVINIVRSEDITILNNTFFSDSKYIIKELDNINFTNNTIYGERICKSANRTLLRRIMKNNKFYKKN